MGLACSTPCRQVDHDALELSRPNSTDPVMYDIMRKSIKATATSDYRERPSAKEGGVSQQKQIGQHHLLFRNSKMDLTTDETYSRSATTYEAPSTSEESWLPEDTPRYCPTRLLIRRRSIRSAEEGIGTHIYAIRYPEDAAEEALSEQAAPRPESAHKQEQYPAKKSPHSDGSTASKRADSGPRPDQRSKFVDNTTITDGSSVYSSFAMTSKPRQEGMSRRLSRVLSKIETPRPNSILHPMLFFPTVLDWVAVSEEHDVYIADIGLTAKQCDYIVNSCEQACRGQYAPYTYAKQTLGCREYPPLAQTCFHPVHTTTKDIIERLGKHKPEQNLQLDDREPHIVKYDVSKKERQKLDMHTDKSEWTFLIALSNGCGVDYEGGGTFFECLDATVHIQRGHALVFPGKLRHCGQKISSGLRFLLVGFLVDKALEASKVVASGGVAATKHNSDINLTADA